MGKVYAVKKGRKTGIFYTWDECKEATNGYPSPDFKSFKTLEEAEAYLDDKDIYIDKIKEYIDNGYAVAFSDGSFDEKCGRYSYGVICIDREFKENELYGYAANPKYISSRNIIGEILGVFNSIDWAITNGYEKIRIFYDYEGLEKWANGDWKAESDVAKMYVGVLESKYKDIIEIEFEKVKGHSNNKYNDKADQLAKIALKDRVTSINTGSNWFVMQNFKEDELQTILDLINEDIAEVEVLDITNNNSKIIKKIKLDDNEITITLYKTGTRKILVQGKMGTIFQVFITYVNELLGINKVEPVIKNVYRKNIDKDKITNEVNNISPNLPTDYPESIKSLIRQSVINLTYYIEAEDYSQYAFPALKALEGHIKYLCNKLGISLTSRRFDIFDLNQNNDYILKGNINVDPNNKEKLERYYNYYAKNRHTIFHFGEIIGLADNTRMIDNKNEVDEIIKEVIKMINEI